MNETNCTWIYLMLNKLLYYFDFDKNINMTIMKRNIVNTIKPFISNVLVLNEKNENIKKVYIDIYVLCIFMRIIKSDDSIRLKGLSYKSDTRYIQRVFKRVVEKYMSENKSCRIYQYSIEIISDKFLQNVSINYQNKNQMLKRMRVLKIN